MYLYLLDLLGVCTFAFLGARAAIGQKCNVLGILICGSLAAVGGGTVREVILNRMPFYFYNYTYLLVIIVASILSIVLYGHFQVIKRYIVPLDAIGTVAFALIGAQAAGAVHLGLVGMVAFAVLTACGGSVLAELACGKAPRAFYDGWYVMPSVILGVAYWLLGDRAAYLAVSMMLFVSVLTVQLLILYASRLRYKLLRIKLLLQDSRVLSRNSDV